MNIDEIKRLYGQEIIEAITFPDGSGKGYVCPLCGSGTGQNGTGLFPLKVKEVPRPGYYHCFACGFTGDVFEMIKKVYNIDDTIEQIKKAEDLIHRKLLDDPGPVFPAGAFKTWDEMERAAAEEPKTPDNTDKNAPAIKDKKEAERIAALIDLYAGNLLKSDKGKAYLKARGISIDTAIKYKLGFTDYYGRNGLNTPALIIPTGPDSFTARSTTNNDNHYKIRKEAAGEAGIFNIECLNAAPPLVFIVEGEIDALSIIQAGRPAIATGGGTSINNLTKVLKEYPAQDLPLFVILPDNDRLPDGAPDFATNKGHAQGVKLMLDLKAAGIPALLFDTTDPDWPADIKDANEFMQRDIIAFTEKLEAIATEAINKPLGRAADFLQDFIDQAAGATPPISTGFSNLDDIIEGGLHPGLIVLGAISSLGKTTFVLNMAENIAAAGKDVLFISLEMSRFELIAKLISRKTALYCLKEGKQMSIAKTNLGISDFSRRAHYSREELELIERCFTDFQAGAAEHLFIQEGIGNIGTADIRRYVQRHIKATGNTPVIMIDYAQIMAPEEVRLSDKQAIDRNIVELKRISRDYNTPVVAISSFNRENYLTPVNMAAFKESGSLEYSSDILIGLQYFGMDFYEGETEKQRAVRIGSLRKENRLAAAEGKPIKIQLKVLKNRSGRITDTGFNYFPKFNLYLS